jgi:RNA polymerase sigma-70 factor, ECF subfamily
MRPHRAGIAPTQGRGTRDVRTCPRVDLLSGPAMSNLALAQEPPTTPVVAIPAARADPELAEQPDPRPEPEPPDAVAAAVDEPDEVEPRSLERLVGAAVAGDLRARDCLLAEIQPLVLRYCRGRLGRQETVIGSADDVAQEVCLAVVNALPGYTIKGLSFRAFVYGIAAHKVTDAFRAIGRNRSDPVADTPDSPVAHDGPEQRLLAGELAQRLDGLLHRLTPRQREVIVLRIAVGLSAEETAQAVSSTPGAVRVTQHRALNRLRALVAEPAVEPDEPYTP